MRKKKVLLEKLTSEAVGELGLVGNEYAVFGSGILGALDIRKSRDIDFIVTRELFEKLKKHELWEEFRYDNGDEAVRNLKYENVEVAYYYCELFPLCDEGNLKRMIDGAMLIDGVRYTNLADTLALKKAWGREKDLQDVKLIEEYLRKEKL